MSIVFLHGLESPVDDALQPIGRKATWLRERYPDVLTPGLDTRAMVALRQRVQAGHTLTEAELAEAWRAPMARGREALATGPDLVIGSSFGGAVLLRLVREEPRWRGPCLFLAGAGVALTDWRTLPDDLRAVLVHGRRDTVIPLAHSRLLVRSAGPQVQLWEVGGDHGLADAVTDGTLAAAIAWLLA